MEPKPSCPSIYSRRVQCSYPNLALTAREASKSLRQLGVSAGDVVALEMNETVEAVASFFALAHLGARILLIDASRENVRPSSSIHTVLTLTERTKRNGNASVTFRDLVHLEPGSHGLHEGGTPQDSGKGTSPLIALFSQSWLDLPDGLIMMSSGSTGAPKAVSRNPRAFLENLRVSQEVLQYRRDDVVLPLVPLSHQYGLSVLIQAILVGSSVVIGSVLRISESVRLGGRFGVTVVESAPDLYLKITDLVIDGKIGRDIVDRWRQTGVGGSPTDRSSLELIRSVLGCPLVDGYGSTEAGNIALANPMDPENGLVVLEGFDLTVTSPQGFPVAPGEYGLLRVRHEKAGIDWNSGDVAKIHEGRLYVAGRGNAVHRRGLVVYPARLEDSLRQAGTPAMVIPYETGRGTRIAAVIEDAERLGKTHWWRSIRSTETLTDLPDTVICLDRYPRLGSGKVDRSRIARALEQSSRPPSAIEMSLERTSRFLRTERLRIIALLSTYQSAESAELEVDGAIQGLDTARFEVALEGPARVERAWAYMPSNVVLYSYVLYAMIPALWCGSIVLRPSSRATEATRMVHELLSDVHRLDIDLEECSQEKFAELRQGQAGLVVFTGRHSNAAKVVQGLEPGQVLAFYGQGTNPFVVGKDADVGRAVRDVVRMRMLNGGQDCFGPDVVFVHEDMERDFSLGLAEAIRQRTAVSEGCVPPLERDVMQSVVAHLWENSSRVQHGGQVDLIKASVTPTVCRWSINERPEIAEIFAPIFHIVVFRREEEVRELLTSDHYRLRWMGASLYGTTRTLRSWFRSRMTVSVDRTLVDVDEPRLPMGGKGALSSTVYTRGTAEPQPLLLSRVCAEYAQYLTDPGEQQSAQSRLMRHEVLS